MILYTDVTENSKIADYLKKGITDQRLNGRKRYLSSQGLKQPIVLEINDSEEFYNNLYECCPTLLDSNTFNSPFSGEFKYENYYIKNTKELMDYVQEF
ncbi:hypothetical protein [Siminovitchia fortis]|uniref:hypothetical protein n=1 Tax=Siminovitchia fortis TaxID=254758 RepID=UPI001643EB87|nr:hypothetical protein [Siminovitchia fortis]